jgi:hypothetical protein
MAKSTRTPITLEPQTVGAPTRTRTRTTKPKTPAMLELMAKVGEQRRLDKIVPLLSELSYWACIQVLLSLQKNPHYNADAAAPPDSAATD